MRGLAEIADRLLTPRRARVPDAAHFGGLATKFRTHGRSQVARVDVDARAGARRRIGTAFVGRRVPKLEILENLNKCKCGLDFYRKSLYALSPTAQYIVISLAPSLSPKEHGLYRDGIIRNG